MKPEDDPGPVRRRRRREKRHAVPQPLAPVLLSAWERGVRLSWERCTMAVSYELDYACRDVMDGQSCALVGGDREWTSVPCGKLLSCEVGSLKPGTPYLFRVRAVPAARAPLTVPQPPPTSEMVTLCTLPAAPSQPSPPTLVRLRARTCVQVKWAAPPESGGLPLEYVVEMTPPPGKASATAAASNTADGFVQVYKGKETSVKVTRLLPGTAYRFRLLATNSVGSSQFSEEAKYVTRLLLPPTLLSASATSKPGEGQLDSTLVRNPGSLRAGIINTEDRAIKVVQNDDPMLQPNHKIFLSHSGYQKDFVEELCGALESRYHFPFFDRRPSSIPKGERFPELILAAARQCQLAVVVLSPEYLCSKWPMIELNAFVQTRLKQEKQNMDTKLMILPLFYGLSRVEFGKAERRAEWYRKWEAMAKDDPRIDVKEWKKAVHALRSFNVMEYHPETKSVYAFRADVVSSICNQVPADIKWDDSHVRGGSSLCQVIQSDIAKIRNSSPNRACVFGLYGVGGIGKTTTCKLLCNELLREFKGKVCHVELGGQSFEDSLKKVLKELSIVNRDFIERLDEGQCRSALLANMKKQKTFLALDNVWPEFESLERARQLLRPAFHEDSVVMVTSRSLETLMLMGVNPSHCFEMPSLGYDDARSLFLHHAAHGTESLPSDVIEKCLALCYFLKGDTRDGHDVRKEVTRGRSLSDPRGHFLPLALKALGVQLSSVGRNPSEWGEVLSKVEDFNYLQEEQNPVFGILGVSFERLRSVEQDLFMDVILFTPSQLKNGMSEGSALVEWLSLVYNQDPEEIRERLVLLQARGLLEEVDLPSGTVYVHDLYREFARLESTGKAKDSTDFQKQRWVYYRNTYPAELEMTPSGRCWQSLTRIAVKGDWKARWRTRSLEGTTWKHFANVVVLKLEGLWELRGDLNLKGLKCLRSLELVDVTSIDSLDGLQDLSNLVYFRWANFKCLNYYNVFKTSVRTRMGQLPSSLEVLQVATAALFPSNVFARCTGLSKLELSGSLSEILDFSNCRNLQSINLSHLELLKTVSGLTEESTASLRSLTVSSCFDLIEIPGLGNMVGLERLFLCSNYQLRKLPDLQKLTRLQVLDIFQSKFEEVPGLGSLRQLRELTWTSTYSSVFRSIKILDLSGLTQLEVIDLSSNYELSSLEGAGIENLPALRCLRLRECWSLKRLPDMRMSRNLKELDIRGCSVELGEEGKRSLSSLPLLQPVVIDPYEGPKFLMPSIPVDDGSYYWSDMVSTCPWLKRGPK